MFIFQKARAGGWTKSHFEGLKKGYVEPLPFDTHIEKMVYYRLLSKNKLNNLLLN